MIKKRKWIKNRIEKEKGLNVLFLIVVPTETSMHAESR